MLLSPVYFAVRRLLRLLTRGGERDDVSREIEILVLRHQLRVLTRGRRMPLRRRDRLLLTAASGLLGRDRWRSFPVSAQTLLRWHRELVRRKSSGSAIYSGSSKSTCGTTAKNDRTVDCRFRRRSREPPRGIGVTTRSSASIDSAG